MIYTLIPLLLIGGGFLRLYSAINKSIIIEESKSWPTAAGKVIHSSYHRKKTYVEIADGAWMKEYYYEILIKYAYSISGKIYSSEKICLSKANIVNSSKEAITMVEKYPKSGDITVYYNPTNPSQAILESRYEDNFSAYLQAIALMGFGIYLFSSGW